jgi:hypothetical protein
VIENRYLRLLIALAAGIVMGLAASYTTARASAAPLSSQVVPSVVSPVGHHLVGYR